jgi:hypothetical protein
MLSFHPDAEAEALPLGGVSKKTSGQGGKPGPEERQFRRSLFVGTQVGGLLAHLKLKLFIGGHDKVVSGVDRLPVAAAG